MGQHPPPGAPRDEDLMPRIAAGDVAAFTALFVGRKNTVYRFALHMTGAPALADDVTQDVFLVVMREAGRFEPGRATVAAWLCGIARNCVRQRLDRDRPIGAPLEEAVEEVADRQSMAADALADLVAAERVEALRRAVASLPVRYREVVVLCDLEEMSYADAATALDCAVGTVRSRLHRGRALLASKMGLADQTEAGERAVVPARPKEQARCMV